MPFQRSYKKPFSEVRLSSLFALFVLWRQEKENGLLWAQLSPVEHTVQCGSQLQPPAKSKQSIPPLWRNPSPLHQTWDLLTQPFSWHQTPLLWLFVSLGFLPTRKSMSQCQMLLPCHSERSLNNITSFNWLVNPNFCSQPGRPWEAKCEMLWKDLQCFSLTWRKVGAALPTPPYLSRCSRSCAINAQFLLEPNHFILTLLLCKPAGILIPGASRNDFSWFIPGQAKRPVNEASEAVAWPS